VNNNGNANNNNASNSNNVRVDLPLYQHDIGGKGDAVPSPQCE